MTRLCTVCSNRTEWVGHDVVLYFLIDTNSNSCQFVIVSLLVHVQCISILIATIKLSNI